MLFVNLDSITDRQTYIQTDKTEVRIRLLFSLLDRQTGRQTERLTDKQTDRQTNKLQTDRQT